MHQISRMAFTRPICSIRNAFSLLLTLCAALAAAQDLEVLDHAEQLADKNPSEALAILDPFLAENWQYPSTEAEIHTLLAAGKALLFAGDFKQALELTEKCLAHDLTDIQKCKALVLKGLIQFRLGNHQDAASAAQSGLNIAKRIDDVRQMASAHNLLGNVGFIQGNLETAINHYTAAIDLLTQLGDTTSLVKLQANLGNIYLQIGRFDDALAYLESCYEQIKDSDDAQMRMVIGINLASIFGIQGDVERERAMYLAALQTGSNAGMDSLLVGVYLNLCDLNIRLEEWEEALANARIGMQIATEIQDPSAIGVALANLGKAHAGSGDFDKAFSYFDQALEQFRSNGLHLQEIEVLGYIADHFAKAGRFEQAYDYAMQHSAAREQMVSQSNQERLQELRASFDAEQQQLRIQHLESEQERQSLELQHKELQRAMSETQLDQERTLRYYLIVTILVGLFLFILLILRYQTQARSNRLLHSLNDELKRNHDDLQKLHRQKDQLIAIVSHDLRNPMHGVLSTSSLLRERDEIRQSEGTMEMVDMIEASCNRAMEILNNLLNSERIQSGNLQLSIAPFDLVDACGDALRENLTPSRLKQQKLHLQNCTQTDRALVKGNRETFIQVLNNLISNSIKYSEAGREILVKLEDQTDCLEVKVTDQGPGISAQEVQRIFEPHAKISTQPTAGESSIGIGLSIVKALVDAMQGTISCESQCGVGTTFTIRLPRA